MEKIKELVDVRFEIINQYKKEIVQLQNENFNLADNSNIQRKILKFMINAKKEEKQRVNSENKLFEIFFSERSNSQSALQQFYQVSLQIMNSIYENFELETEMIFCKEPQYIDVATLFIEFFQQTNFSQRADEIKMIMKNDLYERVPFFCLLLKWLVEMTRAQFGEFIKENSDIYLKQLTQNRNKGSQKEIATLTPNQEYEYQSKYPSQQKYTDHNNSSLMMSETLQTEKQQFRDKKQKRSSMNSLDNKQLDFLTGSCNTNNTLNNLNGNPKTSQLGEKQPNNFRNSMQNFSKVNSQTQLQILQNGGYSQVNPIIQSNVYNYSINHSAPHNNNSSNNNGPNNSTINQQSQFSTYSSQQPNIPVDKKKQSPHKRQQSIMNSMNDVLDLEVNNFSMEMISFLMKKLASPDGSISEQGKQSIVNFMVNKNVEVKTTIEEYFARYSEKFPQIIKQQQMLNKQISSAKQADKIQKRKKMQVVSCYGQNNNNQYESNQSNNNNQNGFNEFRRHSQFGRSEYNSTNTARPFSQQGAYYNSLNQSLNQSQIKIEKRSTLTSSFDMSINQQEAVVSSSSQIHSDQQSRPSSCLKNDSARGGKIIIEAKVKHLSLDQNYNSQNNNPPSQINNANPARHQGNANNKLPYSGSLFSSENISQERQVQHLTKLSQEQFVQRMRSTHKIYYLSRKNNHNNIITNNNNANNVNQTGSTNNSTQTSQNSQGFQDNHIISSQKGQPQAQKQFQNFVTPIKVTPSETNEAAAALSTIILPTQVTENQQSVCGNLDKVDTIDYSSVIFTSQSSNRNQPQHPLVIPNPQYQYFHSANIKQPQPNIQEGSSRPKTASVTENNNRTQGLKGKLNIQYMQTNKRQRSRSINQQLSQGKKCLPSNWVVVQQNYNSTQSQQNNGDVIKRIADMSYQATLNNSITFYGAKDSRGTYITNISNQNPQIGSTTLPIQTQFQQTGNQFRVSSAKRQINNNHGVENNTNIKEKFYQISKEKRRMSQTAAQQNQFPLYTQKIENPFQNVSQIQNPNNNYNNQQNFQRQSQQQKQTTQAPNNSINGVTSYGTRAKMSFSVGEPSNSNYNSNNERQMQQQAYQNGNYKPHPSNINSQDINVNLVQQSVIQLKQIESQINGIPQTKLNSIRVTSKKR